jgi:hypothetical protein
MVKGISRQVIVVQSPEPKLFEQAIFILSDAAVDQGVTDEMLLRQAQKLIRGGIESTIVGKRRFLGPMWACGGAAAIGMVWWLTALL